MPRLTKPVLSAGSFSVDEQSVIGGEGLILRPWLPADRPAVLAGYTEPDIQRWHCRSMDDDEARDWIAGWTDRWQAETGAGYAIVEDDGDDWAAVSGQISLTRLNLADGLGAVSYWVLPSARGRGVARRALSALAGVWFARGLQRIEVEHSTANLASCRVALAAGFRLEGTKRQEALHTDGWHDMHLHAKIWSDEP